MRGFLVDTNIFLVGGKIKDGKVEVVRRRDEHDGITTSWACICFDVD